MNCPLCGDITVDLDAHVSLHHASASTLDVLQALFAARYCTICGAYTASPDDHTEWHTLFGDAVEAVSDGLSTIRGTLAATAIAFDALNDDVERIRAGQAIYEAHVENLIERVYMLEADGALAVDVGEVAERVSDLASMLDAVHRHVEGLDRALDIVKDHTHSVGAGGAMSGHTHTVTPPTLSHSHTHGSYTAPPSSPF